MHLGVFVLDFSTFFLKKIKHLARFVQDALVYDYGARLLRLLLLLLCLRIPRKCFSLSNNASTLRMKLELKGASSEQFEEINPPT